ncbi:MAG: HDIG domain-containing protein [Verrucomicrobiae bacterium]|nr:HDIG domain-containing protein [Verrucomicrobiae bacterium]
MFEFFSQLRLKRKGFSSGKKRRKQREHPLLRLLREGRSIGFLLLVALVAAVSGLAIYAADPLSVFAGQLFKTVVVVTVLTATLVIQLRIHLPETLKRNSRITLLVTSIIGQLLLLKFSEYLADTFAHDGGFHFLVAPYAFAPMLMALLLGRNHATYAAIYASLFGALLVQGSLAFEFLIFSLVAGSVAVYLTHKVRRRGRLMTAGGYVGFAVVAVGFTLGVIQWPLFSELGSTPEAWDMMGRQALAAVLVSTVTAVLVGGLLPIIEGAFRITTDISWIELADLNHPLLKRMTIEAPGTYHHSLVVANLAESAAEAVGANATLCRVCAYFHDIGKLTKPEYFIENIGDGENPHDDLTPTMSALIVIAHVKDGVDLALKYKLNREIIAVIREHHGTSMVQYFYHRALKQKEDFEALVREGQERSEDVPDVDQEGFRYPGPRPQTRESAIISLADAVESASRCLQKPTPQKIEQLIEELTRGRLREGQFDECPLTLQDLSTIKASFYSTLRSMMHNRISYPKAEGGLERSSTPEIKTKSKASGTGSKTKTKAKGTVTTVLKSSPEKPAAPATPDASAGSTETHSPPPKDHRPAGAA